MDLSSIAHAKCGRKCAEKLEVVGCTRRQTWALKCLSGGVSLSSWVFCFISVLSTFTNHQWNLFPTTKMKNRPLSLTNLLTLKKVLYKYHVQNITDFLMEQLSYKLKTQLYYQRRLMKPSHSFCYIFNSMPKLWIAVVLEQVL